MSPRTLALALACTASWFRKEKLFPDLGEASKVYSVTLTERDINTIYALQGFALGAASAPKSPCVDFWDHYGETATALVERLSRECDD